jgi:hypothetical protein
MASNQQTAEQKLLKMIESAGATEVKTKTEQKVLKKQSLLSTLKSLNKILSIGVIISGVYLVYEVYHGIQILNQDIKFTVDSKASKKVFGLETAIPTFQNVSFYLSSISRRNIFQPIDTERAKTVDSSDRNSKLAQNIQNLKLVGISWLDTADSASVMIEDTDKKVTYFLQKGEKIGDITVKTIYADSAVLGYGNEEITIRYDKPQM